MWAGAFENAQERAGVNPIAPSRCVVSVCAWACASQMHRTACAVPVAIVHSLHFMSYFSAMPRVGSEEPEGDGVWRQREGNTFAGEAGVRARAPSPSTPLSPHMPRPRGACEPTRSSRHRGVIHVRVLAAGPVLVLVLVVPLVLLLLLLARQLVRGECTCGECCNRRLLVQFACV